MTTVHKHEHSNILHTCTGRPEGGDLETTSTKRYTHWGDWGVGGGVKKTKKMQKSTCKYSTLIIYRHVACQAAAMATGMGGG